MTLVTSEPGPHAGKKDKQRWTEFLDLSRLYAQERGPDLYALVVQANPGVPAELITGDTIEEVNVSLKNAQAIVDRVRQEMEAEASKTKIPAGAPQRTPPDLSALSPREKIKYAIGGER